MERADELALIRRVTAHLTAKTSDLAEAPTQQPVHAYFDHRVFADEMVGIFRRVPFVAGHRSLLAEAGDYITGSVNGLPWLVTCPQQGELRAFVNACRHRGTQLVQEPHGTGCKTFTCPYHAWSYHADGRLLGIAHERTFGDIDRAAHGLVPLSVSEHAGLIWLTLTDDVAPSFPAPLARDLNWLGMADHVVYRPHRRRWRFNWKLGIDGGLEAYHFRYAHGRSIYPMFFDNLLVYDEFAPHARLTLPKRSIRELAEPADDRWRIREHANLLYFLFPNTFLIAQADYVALICMTPTAPDESEIAISMLIPELPRTERARAHWDKNFEIMVGALDEDFELGERIQATLRSGANSHLSFGRNELGLARFHAAVQHHLASLA